MPELPEVETVVRGLRPVLAGARIAHVAVNRPDLRRPFPEDLGQRLTGATVTTVERRAKYGLIATDRDDTLIFHLGMSGRFRLDPETPSIHDHFALTTDAGRRVVLTDPRRFGMVDLVATAALAAHPLIAPLGVEPLSPALTGPALAAMLEGRATPIKAALLDQRRIAGIGNIYASEALHRARIHPDRLAGMVTRGECGRLVKQLKAVLEEAIAAGGSSLRDHIGVNGELGYFQKSWRVYGRAGEPCGKCAKPIARLVQSGRSTFLCTSCQR